MEMNVWKLHYSNAQEVTRLTSGNLFNMAMTKEETQQSVLGENPTYLDLIPEGKHLGVVYVYPIEGNGFEAKTYISTQDGIVCMGVRTDERSNCIEKVRNTIKLQDIPNYDTIQIYRWFQSQGHYMISRREWNKHDV